MGETKIRKLGTLQKVQKQKFKIIIRKCAGNWKNLKIQKLPNLQNIRK